MADKIIHLVQVNDIKFHDQSEIPWGLLYLGSSLKQAGFNVNLINATHDEIDKYVSLISKEEPLFVGFSVMTGMRCYHSAIMSKKIKRILPHVQIVWGGVHPSSLPEQCLSEDYIDSIIIGEGEETIVELAKKLKRKEPIDKLAGVGTKKNGKIIINPMRDFIKDLDSLKIDYDLIDLKKYYSKLLSYKKLFSIITSRGCPFNCSFCYNRQFNKNTWRSMTAKRVIKDIRFFKDAYNMDGIKFWDDNFYVNKNRALEILRAIKLPFYSEIRMDMLNPSLAEELKKLNPIDFLIGLESGSERIQKMLNKGYSVKKIKPGVRLLTKNKLHVSYAAIMGVPTETNEDIKKTLDLLLWINRTHKQSYFTVGFYLPFPGSLLYEFAKKHGFNPPKRTEDWGIFYRGGGFKSPWIDSKKAYFIRQYAKFTGLNLPLVGGVFEYRLRHQFFKFPVDEKIMQFLINESIDEKNIVGKAVRNAYAVFAKRDNE